MAIQYSTDEFLKKINLNQNFNNTNLSYNYTYKKKVNASNLDIETLQDDIENLKKSIKKLAKYSEDLTPRTAVKKQLESLVKTYNTYKKNTGKITDDETKEQIEKLEKLFSDNERALKKLGLTKSDKKMELDSDIFDKADKKNISKLFEGRDSFAKKADKIIRKMEECAGNAQYKAEELNIGGVMRYSLDDVKIASMLAATNDSVNRLTELSDSIDDGNDNEGILKTKAYLKAFADNIVSVSDNNEYLDELKSLFTDDKNKYPLSRIGISVKNKTIEYDENISNFDSKTFIDLFGKNAEFGKSVKAYCTASIEQILKTEKIGVSLVDVYV